MNLIHLINLEITNAEVMLNLWNLIKKTLSIFALKYLQPTYSLTTDFQEQLDILKGIIKVSDSAKKGVIED